MANHPVLASRRDVSKLERRAAGEIATYRVASSVLAARECARLDAITDVAQDAMLDAAALSGLELALVMRTPHAANRVGRIADSACIALERVVVRTSREL
jgi:hypothetical protein